MPPTKARLGACRARVPCLPVWSYGLLLVWHAGLIRGALAQGHLRTSPRAAHNKAHGSGHQLQAYQRAALATSGRIWKATMDTTAPTPRRLHRRKAPLDGQAGVRPTGRSRISNGHLFVDAVTDGRSGWSRRIRDLIAFYVAHLGGEDVTTIAERSIIRRAATIEVELEWLERQFALSVEGPSPELLDLYSRTTNTLRRLLETIGLKRVARDVTPLLQDYLAQHPATREEAHDAGEEASSP
jgi:hypothetical protein